MKKQYSRILALALMKRMANGESIASIHKETGISTATLWRWREGKSFPQRGLSKREYYEENRQQIINRVKRNRYGGKYFIILKRDNYKCQSCYHSSYLQIHHIDGNEENNSEDNLIVLCRGCHRLVHLMSLVLNNLDVIPYGKIYELAKKISI